jgi:hypothetical protein
MNIVCLPLMLYRITVSENLWDLTDRETDEQ